MNIPGSSPLARGRVVCEGVFDAISGVIPACAGESSRVWVRQVSTQGHPRVCGGEKI